MTDSIIERMARAMCSHEGLPENTKKDGKPMWMDFIPEVRAALAAMRKPTLEMRIAGDRIAWENMIDTALSEGKHA